MWCGAPRSLPIAPLARSWTSYRVARFAPPAPSGDANECCAPRRSQGSHLAVVPDDELGRVADPALIRGVGREPTRRFPPLAAVARGDAACGPRLVRPIQPPTASIWIRRHGRIVADASAAEATLTGSDRIARVYGVRGTVRPAQYRRVPRSSRRSVLSCIARARATATGSSPSPAPPEPVSPSWTSYPPFRKCPPNWIKPTGPAFGQVALAWMQVCSPHPGSDRLVD